ncbi:MAG TPA: HAMP domain-containing sensor histidine kinase [Longimicrobium sp.]|jgi:signal transduction histidine kinase
MALPIPGGGRWKDSRLSRSLPAVVLVLTLALSGVLAYQAQDAARSHRAASEGALRDYGAFAGWELGRRIEESARQSFTRTLGRGVPRDFLLSTRGPEEALAEFVLWSDPARELCRCPGAVHDLFYLRLADGRIAVAESVLPVADHRWMREEAMKRRRDPAPSRREVTLRRADGGIARRISSRVEPVTSVPLPGHPSKSLLYAVVRTEDGTAAGVYGFVLDLPRYTRSVIGEILRGPPLLPPTHTRGAPNDAVLAIAVASPAGEPVFRSRGTLDPSTLAVDTIGGDFGRLVVRVGVRPEIAERLVIGGLPRSRLPLLAGVLLLTLVLGSIALVQLRRQQELTRLRSDFVSGVSHELRTPLAQIRLFADLLEAGRMGEAQRARSIRIIRDEARRLSYLVENVLCFARSERRPELIAPEPAEVARVVRETVESFAPLAEARGTELEMEGDPGARAALDPDAARQVVLNLLDNAVKYGPVGQRVRVRVERRGAEVCISVEDEGPGIPPAERERIWQPYYRLPGEQEKVTGGSGIGLAVVRGLVALHGGTTAVESAPGGGARFLVLLPALRAGADAARLQGVAG